MLRPTKMARIDLQIPEDDIAKITLGIANLNIIHLMNVRKTPLGELNIEASQENVLTCKYKKLKRRIDSVCQALEIELDKVPWCPYINDINPHGDIIKIENEVTNIEEEIMPVVRETNAFKEQRQEKVKLLQHTEIIQTSGLDFSQFHECRFLYITAGLMPIENLERLELSLSNIYHITIPSTKLGKRRLAFIMGSAKDQEKIEKALRSAYFEKLELYLTKSSAGRPNLQDLRDQIGAIDSHCSEAEFRLNKIKTGAKKHLLQLNQRILLSLNILETAKSFDKVGSSYHISGWIPQDIVPALEREVKKASTNQAKISVLIPNGSAKGPRGYLKIPTCLKNPFFLQPFEKIIFGYGIPNYNEVEPTIFFALSFLIMFGVMFGDVGHGLTLFVLGLFGYKKTKKEFIRQMGLIIMECGIMSTIFGLLYGSFFGFEHVLPALWFSPMSNIYYFMKLTVGFGIGIISLGLILNIINSIKNGEFLKGIFGEMGMMGLVFYWGCVGLIIIYMVNGKLIFTSSYVLWLLLFPLVMIFFKEPLYNLYSRVVLRKDMPIFPSNLGLYFMEGIIEIGDTIIGFLSNTVSFIRISAFALAHAGLFFAVFSLAHTLQTIKWGFFWYWLIVIIGNICIIAIEGLVVSIQTIRLEYYEFFSKFFKGGGELYSPLMNK
ncbi:MAG: V-type ATP synthase subunit I [bacterium]